MSSLMTKIFKIWDTWHLGKSRFVGTTRFRSYEAGLLPDFPFLRKEVCKGRRISEAIEAHPAIRMHKKPKSRDFCFQYSLACLRSPVSSLRPGLETKFAGYILLSSSMLVRAGVFRSRWDCTGWNIASYSRSERWLCILRNSTFAWICTVAPWQHLFAPSPVLPTPPIPLIKDKHHLSYQLSIDYCSFSLSILVLVPCRFLIE